MFRFTIRELVLVTLVVAMGVAWWMDRIYTTSKLADKQASIHRLVRQVEVLELNLKLANPKFQPSTSSGSVIEGP
jgi:hypothetical protein